MKAEIIPPKKPSPDDFWAEGLRVRMLPSATAGEITDAIDWTRPAVVLSARQQRLQEWYFECTIFGYQTLHTAVDVDPRRRGGVPVLKGTRFTVAQTLAELAHSDAVEELAQNFELDVRVIREMLNGLSLILSRPFPK